MDIFEGSYDSYVMFFSSCSPPDTAMILDSARSSVTYDPLVTSLENRSHAEGLSFGAAWQQVNGTVDVVYRGIPYAWYN